MLHATIRCGDSTVHVIGDVTAYNLETLVDHARFGLTQGEHVSMTVEVDPDEREMFMEQSQRWMRELTRSGVRIDVAVAKNGRGQATILRRTAAPSRRFGAFGN